MTGAPPSIAFDGANPTTIYTFCTFLDDVADPAEVVIYEDQPRARLGTRYRAGWNAPVRLLSIASIEIATDPHLAIDRMLALHRAGCLDVTARGSGHRVNTHDEDAGAIVTIDGERQHYPALTQAMGQRPLDVEKFSFPSLIEQRIVNDAGDGEDSPSRSVAIEGYFHPVSQDAAAQRLFCLSTPFVLSRRPVLPSFTSSHEIGAIVGADLARAAAVVSPIVAGGAA